MAVGQDAMMPDRETVEYVGIFVGIVAGLVAIGGGVIAIVVWLRNRKPRPTVSICIDENYGGNPPVMLVKIVNDSATDLNVVEPASLVVDDPRYPSSIVRLFHRQRVDDGKTYFPQPLGKQGRIVSRESMSQLADDLRMLDCWPSCLVRGVFRDSLDNRLTSPRYLFPLEYWLEPDASALRHTPTGPQTTDTRSRIQAWWALNRAKTIYACPRWGYKPSVPSAFR